MNLYPYNVVVFVLSVVILCIYLLKTLQKGLSLKRAVEGQSDVLQSISNNLNAIQNKTEAIQQAKEEKKKNWTKVILPILFTTYQIYQAHDELHGIPGYAKATQMAMKKKKR